MKKIFLLFLCCVLLLCTSCKQKPEEQSVTSQDTNVVQTNEPTNAPTNVPDDSQVDEGKEEENKDPKLKNGDFETSMDPEVWMIFTMGGEGSFSVKDGKGVLSISSVGSVDYGVQLYQDIGKIRRGGVYRFQFDASSTIPRKIQPRIQINSGDYHAYVEEKELEITTEMKTYTLDFTMEEDTDVAPRLVFNCGNFIGYSDLGSHEIYFDNVKVELLDDSNVAGGDEEAILSNININQIGYLVDGEKTVVFRNGENGDKYEIIDVNTNEAEFSGSMTGERKNETAGETDAYGDFSSFNKVGTYIIRTEKLGESYPFVIQKDVYETSYRELVKMLYLQRCGMDLSKELAGEFAHGSCHNTKATIYGTNKKIDVSGGWHDAGDYGRYVVPGVKTIYDLLFTVEFGEDVNQDDVGIPESGNGIPDLLDEARYELDWMLKMQNSENGGVYHKVTCAKFPDLDVMPQDEKEELIVSPITLSATGDFAAIMARASRIYEQYDKKFAVKCLNAAKRAMDYLEKNPDGRSFKNPDGIETGEYPDVNSSDERYLAACEMYVTTGESKYLSMIEESVKITVPKGFGWADMGSYATVTFLTSERGKKASVYATIKDSFIREADALVEMSKLDGYRISLGKGYSWGSNGAVANNAMHLLLANIINPNLKYITFARAHMDYCFGCNPLSTSYVSNTGTVSPMQIHHRPSIARKKSMPGLLVGGPNANKEDPFAKTVLDEMPPAKCYVDNVASYSTNEVTIYWNSPFIFVVNKLK